MFYANVMKRSRGEDEQLHAEGLNSSKRRNVSGVSPVRTAGPHTSTTIHSDCDSSAMHTGHSSPSPSQQDADTVMDLDPMSPPPKRWSRTPSHPASTPSRPSPLNPSLLQATVSGGRIPTPIYGAFNHAPLVSRSLSDVSNMDLEDPPPPTGLSASTLHKHSLGTDRRMPSPIVESEFPRSPLHDGQYPTPLRRPSGHDDGDGGGEEGQGPWLEKRGMNDYNPRTKRWRFHVGYLEGKDQSMNVAINAIRRLEYKVEHLTALVASQHETLSIRAVDQNDTGGQNAHALQSPVSDSTYAIQEADPAALSSLEGFPSGPKPISFSQHRVLFWPAIRPMLPRSLKYACKDLTRDYVIDLENHRPTLDMSIQPHPRDAGDAWLKELPASTINGLSTAFFSTFNRLMPALNRSSFTKSILGAALANDFGHQIETCLALVVMALGCLAVRGYEEGDYPLPVTPAPDFRPAANKLGSEGHFKAPTWYAITQEDPPGLRFFNEARRRFGFLMCANNLESCQYYLLSALYHAQIIRPLDSWALINRAAVIILVILKSADSIDYDSEEGDMISRVYWNVLMYESILVQEMNLPSSDLLRYEDTVPLPKFTTSQRQPHAALSSDEDDSYFYYHFLAQATHRKLLTRIRNSLFFDCMGLFLPM
ncbi:hypothetical protein H2201_005531 [Coniosporium apollinis]|uniref:Transcription factor domain-containing protein n=1 Tax=Coniosporium apollinis TaxID=61459 RepID=A0ABQ9NPF1_9PEZI|nr:hypothetical protein H2201_005531 [Coniosporium apollinis]